MNQHVEDIKEIRRMMERSSRFLSLSGMSGVLIGITALVGLFVLYWRFDLKFYDSFYPDYTPLSHNFFRFAAIDALLILGISLLSASLLTWRRAKKEGVPVWDGKVRRLMINLMIPLIAGGIFCVGLIMQHSIVLIPSATLLFYGLSLINASKYTLEDIRMMGIGQCLLGMLAALLPGYGLIFWATGFGVLHIIYGIVMYRKYERVTT